MHAPQHEFQRHADPHLARGHIGELHMDARTVVHLHHANHGGRIRRGEKCIERIGQQRGAAFGIDLLPEAVRKATANTDSGARKLRFAALAALPGER